MKFHSVVAALGTSITLVGPAAAAPTSADVLVLMDESGSMSGEQAWVGGAMVALDAKLATVGVTSSQFGSVGFAVGGGPGLTRFFNMPGPGTSSTYGGLVSPWGAAGQVGGLAYSLSGNTEDGWAAIAAGTQYAFRSGSARNFILITDEDRDSTSTSSTLTFDSVLASLTGTSSLLNAIVNASFSCVNGNGVTVRTGVIGIGDGGACYIEDGLGSYSVGTGGAVISDSGTTKENYIDMALATGGAAWSLNILRQGGLHADSFTAAFVDIKVREITTTEVPEPAGLALTALALAGAGMARRRRPC